MKSLVAVALVLGVSLMAAGCARQLPLKGTVIGSPQTASDFALIDQHGNMFRLADQRGKVVVLSFIYTHCTDICPFETLKIKATLPLLGSGTRNVVFVAITTDPERDTKQVVADYSREAGLFDIWHFLTGSPDSLKRVWANYGIGVLAHSDEAKGQPEPEAGSPGREVSPTQGLTNADLQTAGLLIDHFGGGYEVEHTAPFWFIDRAGKLRATMDEDALPDDIAYNIRELSNGR